MAMNKLPINELRTLLAAVASHGDQAFGRGGVRFAANRILIE